MSRAGGVFTQCLARLSDNIEDSAGRLGPSDGFGRRHIVGFEESADLVLQFAHAGDIPAHEGTPLRLAERGLDRLEP